MLPRSGNLRSDSSFRLAQLAWQRLAACGLQSLEPFKILLVQASIRVCMKLVIVQREGREGARED